MAEVVKKKSKDLREKKSLYNNKMVSKISIIIEDKDTTTEWA